jgi:hypothetical protein
MYRAVVVVGLLWVIAVVTYGVTVHAWRGPREVASAYGWSVAQTLRECGIACSEIAGKEALEIDPGERLLELVAGVERELGARIQAAQQRVKNDEVAQEAAKAAVSNTDSPDLRDLRRRAAAAKDRYELARLRYESGEGDSLMRSLAMNEARRIYESAASNLREKEQGQARGGSVVREKFEPPSRVALAALQTAEQSIRDLGLPTAYREAVTATGRARMEALAVMAAAALIPIVIVVIGLETLAWVIRGFAKT